MANLLTYKEWVSENLDTLYGVDDPRTSYLKYLTDNVLSTYSQSTSADVSDIKKENLITFLLELGSRGKEQDTANIIRSIDFTSPSDVENAIPQYSSILTDISKYISTVRPQLSLSADEIALSTSKSGILGVLSSQIRSLLIDNGYSTSFTIDIDHYYDDNIYFDKETDTGDSLIDMGIIANSPSNPDLIESAGSDKSEYINYDLEGPTNNEYAGKLTNKYISTSFYTTDENGDIIEYNTAEFPSFNLSNMYFPTVAIKSKDDNLYLKDDVGKYFIPSKLGLSSFIGNGGQQYDARLDTKFPDSIFRTNGYGYTGNYQDSAIINSSSFSWMDIVSISWGDVLSNYSEYQRMIPYQSDIDTNRKTLRGVIRSDANLDPWTGALDNQWSDVYSDYVEYRGIYDNREWYSNLGSSRGIITDCGCDIKGNDIGLFKQLFNQSIKDRELDTGTVYIRYINGDIINHIDEDESIDSTKVKKLYVDYDLITLVYSDSTICVYKYIDGVYSSSPIVKITQYNHINHSYDYITKIYKITIKDDINIITYEYNIETLIRTTIFQSSNDAEYNQYQSVIINASNEYENIDTFKLYGDTDVLIIRDIADRNQDPSGGGGGASSTFYTKVETLIGSYYSDFLSLYAGIQIIFNAGLDAADLIEVDHRHNISESELLVLQLESINDNYGISGLDPEDEVVVTLIIKQMCAIYAGFGVAINTFVEIIDNGVGTDSLIILGSLTIPTVAQTNSYLYRIISVARNGDILIVGYQNRITFNIVYQSINISE